MAGRIEPYPVKNRRQPILIVVEGSQSSVRYVTSNGDAGAGPPEETWNKLGRGPDRKVPYFDYAGRLRQRTKPGYGSIVLRAKKGSIRDMGPTCDARHWKGISSGSGKYKKMIHQPNGLVVRSLGINADMEDAMSALIIFTEYCNSRGVPFTGSFATAIKNLFATTLAKPLTFWSPESAELALLPARSEMYVPPSSHYGMAYFDIKSAHPAAMMHAPIPTRWKQSDPEKWMDHPNGYSLASCHVSSDNPPPHPLLHHFKRGTKRESCTWGTGAFGGTWPHLDMIHASETDDYVRANETWVPVDYTDAFASPEWEQIHYELRSLPGLAGTFGKMATNNLWGALAFDNSKDKYVTWTEKDGNNDTAVHTKMGGQRMIAGLGIAVAVSSRVRDTLWRGILTSGAIYADTDGIIAPRRKSPMPKENGMGSWCCKQTFDLISLKRIQCYRWYTAAVKVWQYLGGSELDYGSAPVDSGRLNGDDKGTAAPMSVRDSYIRRLNTEVVQ